MIGIIGAENEEIKAIQSYMMIEEEIKKGTYTFFKGTIENKDVILMHGGIGKVNAAVATTLLLTLFPIDYVLNIGSAGGLNPKQNVGDIVVSTNVVHYDVDVTAFGKELGQVPGMPTSFQADEHLLAIVQKALKNENRVSHIGLITSGDQFVAREDQVNFIHKNFHEAICVEMEAASIAQVCYAFNIKFIIIRSLSDVYGHEESAIQFDIYLKNSSQVSAKLCHDVIELL